MKIIKNSIKFYYATAKLKEILRSGPVQWRVEAENKETIADHVYGTLMLAISLRDVIGKNVDFEKVFLMLAIHETEEIKIGDFTVFSKVTEEEKKNLGKKAVEEIFAILGEDVHSYAKLLEEYADGKTNEARFAKACDKLECVLEFKKQCDRGTTSIKNITPQMLENKRMKDFYDAGYALDDVFYLWHMRQFEDLGFTDKLWFDVIKPIKSTFVQNAREK